MYILVVQRRFTSQSVILPRKIGSSPTFEWLGAVLPVIQTYVIFFNDFSADITRKMIKRCRVTKLKVPFPVLVLVFFFLF